MNRINYSIFAFILTALFINCTQQNQYDLLIKNINVIDGAGNPLRSNQFVYIDDGKIVQIQNSESTQSKSVIDGTGKYLIPGLFDCHAHTAQYEYDFPRFVHYGVTTIFVPGGSTCTNEYYELMRDMGNQDTLPAPKVIHTSQHFIKEGGHPVRTYANSNWEEGKTVFYLKDTAQINSLIEEVSAFPIAGIKLTIEDGPMPPPLPRLSQGLVNHVVNAAAKKELEVFVHVSDNIELRMAVDAGITKLLHFTGVNLDFESDRILVEKIYNNNISWVTTLMLDKSFMYPLYPNWVDEHDLGAYFDLSRYGELQSKPSIEKAKRNIKFLKEDYGIEHPDLESVIQFQVDDIHELFKNGVNMVLGTDTGNDFIYPGYSLHEEMQLLEMGGMNPLDILKMGTHNAAKMLGIHDRRGTIEVGKEADFIILNQDPLLQIKNTLDIHSVYKNGIKQNRISL